MEKKRKKSEIILFLQKLVMSAINSITSKDYITFCENLGMSRETAKTKRHFDHCRTSQIALEYYFKPEELKDVELYLGYLEAMIRKREETINYCSENECPANTQNGSCFIKTCILIDPEQAIKELNAVKVSDRRIQLIENRIDKLQELGRIDEKAAKIIKIDIKDIIRGVNLWRFKKK